MLKPTGSLFVNLGDKRAGSGGHNNSNLPGNNSRAQATPTAGATRRNAPDRYNQEAFGRAKSKMLLPHRYAIGCEDGLADPEGIGWIVRQDQVWHKLNGLPESVTDRTRDQHEYWFHLTKSGRYYSAIDELREQYDPKAHNSPPDSPAWGDASYETWGLNGTQSIDNPVGTRTPPNPLGKLPGSVQAMSSEPLVIPEWARADLPDHFAAFPQEWPRRLILGWSPPGICTVCGEGRFPVADVDRVRVRPRADELSHSGANGQAPMGGYRGDVSCQIAGYACSCTPRQERQERQERTGPSLAVPPGSEPRQVKGSLGDAPTVGPRWTYDLTGWTPPPTRPAVVLDPFGGTGTVCGVANVLGRTGISLDLSWDYSRLGQWRVEKSGHFSKSIRRTEKERQGQLF